MSRNRPYIDDYNGQEASVMISSIYLSRTGGNKKQWRFIQNEIKRLKKQILGHD